MVNTAQKTKLDDILSSFNLCTIINFPTRIGPKLSIIDNIFIGEQQFTSYDVISMSNGLSDHEAQLFIAHHPENCTIKRITNEKKSK
jgi:hypothetical protein